MIEPTPTSRLATQSFEVLLSALGWLKLETKPSRFERLRLLFENFCIAGSITRRDAQVVHGLLNFMLGVVMGRSLKVVCRAFSNLAAMEKKLKPEEVRHLCNWTGKVISQLQPRTLSRGGLTSSVNIFTDAAFESGVASWGVVVIDDYSGICEVLELGGSLDCFGR